MIDDQLYRFCIVRNVCSETDVIIYSLLSDRICLRIKAVYPFVSVQCSSIVRLILMYCAAGNFDVAL